MCKMAHGLNALKRPSHKSDQKASIGSRRIFAPHFKLQVLDSYRTDADCKGNQRATARKYGIHRRQIQKWLQVEPNLRNSVAPPPADCAAPIDLSLKKPAAPLPPPASPPPPPIPPRVPSPLYTPHPDVWDLSKKAAPVRLFKPYLDDCYPKQEPTPPCCSYFNNNNSLLNNNNLSPEIKAEYPAYTLHELQTPSPTQYCYPYAAYPEYGFGAYEEVGPMKQRHSYSLDFKLSAIDCYYQDEVCKGNQRAVASKYNIHRRQVQKWLKQADELRERNESSGKPNAVR